MASELTLFIKANGPLTKRISLHPDGTLNSDGLACLMTQGVARRLPVTDANELAVLIEKVAVNQALGLGRLRFDLPSEVDVVTKDRLNGAMQPLIARTRQDIVYAKDQPGFALLDHDAKGMPASIRSELIRHGGFWRTLSGSVLSGLANTARVSRRSTSAGLYRADTGERLSGSGGIHVYIAVQDCADIERFLRVLHDRCWLAGFGWYMVGVGGQLLDRPLSTAW